ncbi:hypothetical protein IKR55_02485 [bacterium]|nr:hypothetical protein [bacterium]
MRIDKIISFAQEINPVRRYRGLKTHYLTILEKGEKDICKTMDIPEKTYLKYKKFEKTGSIFDRLKVLIYQLYNDKHYRLLNTSFQNDDKARAFFAALFQTKKEAAYSTLYKTYPYKLYSAIDKMDTGIPANIRKAVFLPINCLRYLIKGDKKIKPLMTQLAAIKGNGDEFTNQAYQIIVKHLRLEDRAPELIIDNTLKNCGEYYPVENVIKIRTNRKRKQIINTIRHEIEHFRQSDIIIRALGIEEYAKIYPQAKIKDLRKNFARTIQAKRKKPNEALMAFIENCIEAKRTYKKKGTKFDYYLNFIEVEARARGDHYQKQFAIRDNITFLA